MTTVRVADATRQRAADPSTEPLESIHSAGYGAESTRAKGVGADEETEWCSIPGIERATGRSDAYAGLDVKSVCTGIEDNATAEQKVSGRGQ